MTSKNEKNAILNSYKLLHKLGRPLGLSCYTLPSQHEKQEITVTTLDIVRLIALFTVHCYLTYHNFWFWDTLSSSHKRDALFNTGVKLITTASLLLTNIGMIVVFFLRKTFWGIVLDLYKIDKEAEKFAMKIQNPNSFKIFQCYLACSITVIFSIFFAYTTYMSLYLNQFDIIYFFSYIKANATFAYLCCKFQFLIFTFGRRFHLLNIMFETKVNTADITTTMTPDDSQRIGDVIFVIGDLHDKLNSLAIRANTYFASMIMPVYGGNFGITLFCCHNLYKTSLSNDETFYFLAIFFLAMAIYFNILIAFITLGSSFTTNTANHLGVLIHKAAARTRDKFILQRLAIISQQVLHRSPTFSCGLFVMDWPMMFSFVSVLASYLIILIQFQNYVNG